MARRILFAAGLVCLLSLRLASTGAAQDATRPIQAEYSGPTDRYPHDIMGSLRAHTDLVVALGGCASCGDWPPTLAIRLPERLVFEDFAPRLVDLNRDGAAEILVVESDQQRGSRLAVWEVTLKDGTPRLVRGAATGFIGARFRWLAPIGAADLDDDGNVEIAYIEKPHLDKILRIVRREGDELRLVASLRGVTNHAIGQETLQSRIEVCDGRAVILALDAKGRETLKISFDGVRIDATTVGQAQRSYQLDPSAGCSR